MEATSYYQQPGHIIAAAVVFPVLALLAVCLRLWTRWKHGQGFRPDDWLIIPAVILTLGQGINLVVGVYIKSLATLTVVPDVSAPNPLDFHTPQLAAMGKVEYFFELTLPLILGFVKLSFLLFYVRIFVVSKKGPISILLHTMIVLVSLWMTACFFSVLFECRLDFWAAWGSAVDMINKCYNTLTFVYTLCVLDFIIDVLVIIIPIPLPLSNQQLRSTGLTYSKRAVAASLTRLIMTIQVVHASFDTSFDQIIVVTKYMYWGTIECASGIMAACLPSLSLFTNLLSFESAWRSIVSVFSTSSSRNRSVDDHIAINDGEDGGMRRDNKLDKDRTMTDDVLSMTDLTRSRRSGSEDV
ncbi:hypothetical protein CP532_1280 [Ophiocordyceps camponoti-leonardi (nom. inval.)]|nr:hypothetical protein CP532_1280 [Ophiocordyceps camponoti-leonardi (nom. inval.)]